MLLFFMLFNCAPEKPVLINGIDYKKNIVGVWKASSTGRIMKQFQITLPVYLEFRKNGDYYYVFTKLGVRNKRKGDYELHLSRRPVWIDFIQKKPLSSKMEGIIRFTDFDTMHIIFYYKNVMRRLYSFGEEAADAENADYQVFKRVERIEGEVVNRG
jgi:hypothetical protein